MNKFLLGDEISGQGCVLGGDKVGGGLYDPDDETQELIVVIKFKNRKNAVFLFFC